tara:strand:- start:340 stop:1233 length:894 start_codon:yes stop_codon:yes gene_type:complete
MSLSNVAKKQEQINSVSGDYYAWAEDRQIKDYGISSSPSLAEFNGKLYLAHQGKNDNSEIWITSTADGVNWEMDKQISDYGITCSPSLAEFNGRLYLTHQGKNGDGDIWWTSTSDGVNWAPDRPMGDFGISSSPSLCTFNKSLYLAHQGKNDDGDIWLTRSLIITGNEIIDILENTFNMPENEIIAFNNDDDYCMIDESQAVAIWNDSGLSDYKYSDPKFDCDDFAFCMRGEASKWNYNRSTTNLGVALGEAWGYKGEHKQHAYNFYITPDRSVALIEPQSGKPISLDNFTTYMAIF